MKQDFKYNIKHTSIALLASFIAVAPSCERRELLELSDATLGFYDCIGYCMTDKATTDGALYDYSALDKDNIINTLNKPDTYKVYMTIMPQSDYSKCTSQDDINTLCNYLSTRCEISPRVRGRGNFNFPTGMPNPSDSLALVKMGFTVNQQNKQK